MSKRLPDLSRFELQCLRRIWIQGETTVKGIHADLPAGPSYSTVRKIVERLEAKGAVKRIRRDGRAWVYRATVSARAMIGKEIKRLLDTLFDGDGGSLVAQLAEMDEISLTDLREVERRLARGEGGGGDE